MMPWKRTPRYYAHLERDLWPRLRFRRGCPEKDTWAETWRIWKIKRVWESLLERRTIMCKGPEVGRNQRRLICLECIEKWRGHGTRLEMRHRKSEILQSVIGILFCKDLICKDLSRSHGKALKDFKLEYDLMRSAFLEFSLPAGWSDFEKTRWKCWEGAQRRCLGGLVSE